MARPTPYTSKVSVPLPDDAEVKAVVGDAIDVGDALNVMKMMTGAGDMFGALVGMVQAVFATDPLALGINMPARCVVIEKLVMFFGESLVVVTPGEPDADVRAMTAISDPANPGSARRGRSRCGLPGRPLPRA